MIQKIILAALVAIVIAAIIFGPKALRVYKMIHLYDEDKIVYNFLNMNKVFPRV